MAAKLILTVVLFLTLTLTHGAFADTLDSLDGNDWQSWSRADKTFFVAGYVAALVAIRDTMLIEESVALELDSTVLTKVSKLIDAVDQFYAANSLTYPLYKAILLWQTWRETAWR